MSAAMPSPRRTAQISPDRWIVGVVAIALVTAIMLASYVFSFTSISEAAVWTGNPHWSHWLAAVFIDGPILTYTISYAVFRWRGEDGKRTLAILYGFTIVSVAVNFAHTSDYWNWDFTQHAAWFGVLIAIGAPIGALLASEEVVRLAFAGPKSGAVTSTAGSRAEPAADAESDGPARTPLIFVGSRDGYHDAIHHGENHAN